MINMIKKMSSRGRIELVVAVLVVIMITASAGMSVIGKNALKAERIVSERLRQENTIITARFEAYRVQSITFGKLEKKERLKIQTYVKRSFRTIPKSTAKLIAEATTELAKKYNLPSSIIVGMMKVESNFNPSAVSARRARGLMQVRWNIWKKVLGEKLDMQEEFDLHNIKEGIEAGVVVFKHYLEKNKGDVSRALYDYVGKNRSYVIKVYEIIGRFMLYDQGE